VREAVSSAVRHVNATTLTVSVKIQDGLTIEVVDNGNGINRAFIALTAVRLSVPTTSRVAANPCPTRGTKVAAA
jgi:hypothetical protein